MVAEGIGVSILPEMCFTNYLDLSVEARELRERPYRDIGIIYKYWDRLSPLSRIFINEAKDYFARVSADTTTKLPWFNDIVSRGRA